MLKKFKNLIHYRKFYGHIFKLIKNQLKNGIYIFDADTKSFVSKKLNKGNVKRIFKSFVCIHFFRTNNRQLKEFRLEHGIHKLVIVNDDYTYCFYESKDYYLKSKKGYKLTTLLNYPLIKIVSFDDRFRCAKQETAPGKRYFDDAHDDRVVSSLISCIDRGLFVYKDDLILMLQHGDAKRDSIFWYDDNFAFIDLDDIGYYPFFYDVIHYLITTPMSVEKMIGVLNNHKKDINNAIKRLNRAYDLPFLDEIMHNYVYWCVNYSYPNDYQYELIEFKKNKVLLKAYPKTYDIVESVYKDY